jgi:hypothetical protein
LVEGFVAAIGIRLVGSCKIATNRMGKMPVDMDGFDTERTRSCDGGIAGFGLATGSVDGYLRWASEWVLLLGLLGGF